MREDNNKQTPGNAPNILSVADLNRQARITLEERFRIVWVLGEMSNFARPRSGHWYFSLKDDDAQVRCAMFVNRNRAVQMQPGDGQLVLVRGRVSLYEGRGDFQIIVDHMEPAGAGALQQAFEALKVKLQTEGLFAADRKRPMPALPMHCAVITSPTGAAIRDVLAVWQRRCPMLRVTLIPSAVQGVEAEAELIHALGKLQSLHELDPIDVALITRGGGSLEDLWSFNLESVARAMADVPVPIVSAVGHEIDVTISDFVADARAPTPSAAAEMIAPDTRHLANQLVNLMQRLSDQVTNTTELKRLRVQNLALRVPSPTHLVERCWLRLDDQFSRIERACWSRMTTSRTHLATTKGQLLRLSPTRQLARHQERLQIGVLGLRRATAQKQRNTRQRLEDNIRLINNLSPLPTMSRGYAVILDANGSVVTHHDQVDVGATVTAYLAKGRVSAQVLDTSDKGLDHELP